MFKTISYGVYKYKTHEFKIEKHEFHIVYNYTCVNCNFKMSAYVNFRYNMYSNMDKFMAGYLTCNEFIIKNIIE